LFDRKDVLLYVGGNTKDMTMSMYKSWETVAVKAGLSHYFYPTDLSKYKEMSKAYFKNRNLPLLQYLYHGDETKVISCTISGEPGFAETINYAGGGKKTRFNIDFNHVRQRMTGGNQGGASVDKSEAPSSVIRRLDLRNHSIKGLEFLTIMPVNSLVHSHITQDSAKSNITLANFPKETWIWALQNAENYARALEALRIETNTLDYEWFLDHMHNIDHEPIFVRIT
jgi:hypothetical protein